jgi:hypothetical protein
VQVLHTLLCPQLAGLRRVGRVVEPDAAAGHRLAREERITSGCGLADAALGVLL